MRDAAKARAAVERLVYQDGVKFMVSTGRDAYPDRYDHGTQ